MAEKGKKTTRPVSMYVFSFWQCKLTPPKKCCKEIVAEDTERKTTK